MLIDIHSVDEDGLEKKVSHEILKSIGQLPSNKRLETYLIVRQKLRWNRLPFGMES
jgi:hypothetical protein